MVWRGMLHFIVTLLSQSCYCVPQIKYMLPKNIDPWSTAGNTGETGHLTQLLWSGSKKVGCGFIEFVTKDSWYTQVKQSIQLQTQKRAGKEGGFCFSGLHATTFLEETWEEAWCTR